ncbi:7-carboxy-7-deazaguanine synthase [hydrothermal vent metagenome]|uniref:7-carboxy-7-deazaguanine synthase n=1 Tax=hydrothermal vent metagenome TaxID=652676 RepID=A0A3B0Z711_9ZZZZ
MPCILSKDLVVSESSLRITEIFYSLQGEANQVGWPTVFIRLTGCPLRCHYCDTAYAFTGGETKTFDAILNMVAQYGAHRVTVTGGEPLAQKKCGALLTLLIEAGYHVSLETSGALSIADIDPRVEKVMDLKTPGSGEMGRNRYENMTHLQAQDQVKFVLTDRRDYDWAAAKIKEYKLPATCDVLFSPSTGQLEARTLADWILADRLNVRMQIQLHKMLWGDEQGR